MSFGGRLSAKSNIEDQYFKEALSTERNIGFNYGKNIVEK